MRRRSYDGRCWWCGRPADSREHKYKRTDIVRIYGAGPYSGDDAPVRVVGEQTRTIQGPNSAEAKFEANLCSKCNNARSQGMDRAYDRFIGFLEANQAEILATSRFDWRSVFGASWVRGKDDVTRYFVKHVGCRLASAEVEIGRDLRRFLSGKRARPGGLDLWAEIRADLVVLDGGFWLGDVHMILNTTTGTVRDVRSFVGYKWLRVNYAYDPTRAGSSNLDPMVVSLPTDFNVHPDEVRARVEGAGEL